LIVNGPDTGRQFPLGEMTVIGRSVDADVSLQDVTVSRQHAHIIKLPAGFMLQDLNSGNGTWINHRRIGEKMLQNGDEFQVGDTILRFTDVSKAEYSPTQTQLTIMDEDMEGGSTMVMDTVDVEKAHDRRSSDAGKDLELVSRRLKAMTEISGALTTTLEEGALLQKILQKLFEVFPNADRGFVILKDATTGQLAPRAAHGRRGRLALESVAISRTIVSAVLREKKAVLSKDAMNDERFAEGASIVNLQMRSVMCAPLISGDEILGIIHLDTQQAGSFFNADDLSLLAGVASQVALAANSARLHDRLMRQQRLEQDLRYANRIQHSFLPKKPPDSSVFSFSNSYRTALEVGGDLYDFIRVSQDEILVAVGDVSGKGIPAALMMAKVSSDMRFTAVAERDMTRMMSRLNESFLESSTEDAFVTLLLLLLNEKTLNMRIASAGHYFPILKRGILSGIEIPSRDTSGFPIGVVPEAEYEIQDVQLEPGDVFIAYTDGIIEAMNASKSCYGTDRLKEVMRNSVKDARGLTEEILNDLRNFIGSSRQSDDITLVSVQVAEAGK